MVSPVQLIRDFMSPAPITIHPQLTVADATERMYTHKIRHLPVVDHGALVGLLSERDAALVAALTGKDPRKIAVAYAMRRDPFTCSPDDRVADVVSVMATRKLGSAVVVEHARVVGMFTAIDAMARLVDMCRAFELLAELS